jgi:CRP-like cAMP-binding protein
MNDVAAIARARGLMDFAGAECVPREVSLIEALLDKDEQRFARLQARDGYGGSLYAMSRSVRLKEPPAIAQTVELLRAVRLFDELDDRELRELAASAKLVACVPTQDVFVQGEAGSSLFVVESGSLRVIIRDPNGAERSVRTLVAGEVFGEMAFLVGERRGATVRSLDYSTLLELDKPALAPLIERTPAILDRMSALVASRGDDSSAGERGSLLDQVQRYFFGDKPALPRRPSIGFDRARALVRALPLFQPLSDGEVDQLARAAITGEHGPGERIVVQGAKGSSMFLIAEGEVEALARDGETGPERRIARLGAGAVFGEMAMLTGERRAASVVAIEPARVLELSRFDLLPLISRRPAIIVAMSELLAERQEAGAIASRVRRHFFG